MADICGDDRFEIIKKAKAELLKSTNIETSEDEMKVLDNFLFRCWQMGWLERYEKPRDPLDIPTMTTEFVKEHGLPCPDGYIFKDENGNVIPATKIVLEKKKKEYDKGTKVRHKTKGMVETVVGICKIKYMGAWVDGVIYEGNDVHTAKPMTFVRVKEDFENNFEVL